MLIQGLQRDVVRLMCLLVAGSAAGAVINLARTSPLGLRYESPAMRQQRLTVPSLGVGGGGALQMAITPGQGVSIVGIEVVQSALSAGGVVMVDARPDLFWELGHIPGAISLPRGDFEKAYPAHESVLRAAAERGRPIILYCADRHCPDAGKLARMLEAKGFVNLMVFEDGWAAWEAAGMKVEVKS